MGFRESKRDKSKREKNRGEEGRTAGHGEDIGDRFPDDDGVRCKQEKQPRVWLELQGCLLRMERKEGSCIKVGWRRAVHGSSSGQDGVHGTR